MDAGTNSAIRGRHLSPPEIDIVDESAPQNSTPSAPKHPSASHTSVSPLETVQDTGAAQNPDQSSSPAVNHEQVSPTPLQSTFKQNSTSWLLACLTSCLLSFSTWFIYTEFISTKQVPRHLQLSPGHTVTAVNILSQLNIFLAWALVDSAFESLRWAMASRSQGVRITTFIAMSRATGFDGVADLLLVPGWHRIWLLFKLLCFFLGFVLLSNNIFTIIYSPIRGGDIKVIAGLAPLNGYSLVPPSVINIYFMTFTRAILSDRTLVTSIPPVSCSGSGCTSILLPGGMDLVRLPGDPNATLYDQPVEPQEPEVVIIYDAPSYQLDFFPIQEGFVFNKQADCNLYAASNEAIHICMAANGTQILAGWSICNSDLYYHDLCLNDTSWTDQPDESTTMVLHKRISTVAYDRTNFSILSVVSISDPEPPTLASTLEVVANYTHIFNLAFTSIPAVLNTSDINFPTYTAAYCAQWDVGFALRLYQDDFRTYTLGPLSVLQGILTVPMQFSTTAWQLSSFGTLPSDLTTKASPASPADRALGKSWVLVVFTAGVGSLIIWSVAALLWIAIWGPNCPNSTKYPEIDIAARSRISTINDEDSDRVDEAIPDFVTLVRQKKMGNGTSRDFRARFRGSRLYVGEFEGDIGIATERGRVAGLRTGQFY